MALNTGVLGGFNYQNITAAEPTTTVIKSGQGILHSIALNNPVATGTIVVYDNTAGSGNIIASFTTAANPSPSYVLYDVHFKTGLTIVTDVAAQNITVSFV